MPDSAIRRTPTALWAVLACTATVILYFLTASTWYSAGTRPDPAQSYYVRLAQGFRGGHLALPIPVPSGLAHLKDPYDPDANLPYRLGPEDWLHDLSYFRGQLYLYFGVAPALLLYWPWVALTETPLPDGFAVALFCSVGFLAGAWVLLDLRKRRFPSVPLLPCLAGLLAFGFASDLTIILQRPKVYEVAISCGFALTMLALAGVWKSLVSERRSLLPLALASLAYGLALGCRPSLAFGAIVLLFPVFAGRTEKGKAVASRAAAAFLPIAFVGVGLLLYNVARFGSPFEFGQHYQLAGDRQDAAQHFSLRYVAFNFRVYFLSAVNWSRHLPFLGLIDSPEIRPAGHAAIEDPYGVFFHVPVTLFALALPFLGLHRNEEASPGFPAFVGGLSALFLANTSVLLLFYGACNRYQVEFLPELILLAVVAFFALDTACAERGGLRSMVRSLWGLAIAFSIAVSLMNAAFHYADERKSQGRELGHANRYEDAVRQFEAALRVHTDDAEAESDLGDALGSLPGRERESIVHLERSIAFDPDDADVHYNLANALLSTPGRLPDAIAHYEAAVRLDPDYVEAHFNLGVALLNSPNRKAEALGQFQEVLKLKPDSEPARQMIERLRPKGP